MVRALNGRSLGFELRLSPRKGWDVNDRLVVAVVFDVLPDDAADVEGVPKNSQKMFPLDGLPIGLGRRDAAQSSLLEGLGKLAQRVVAQRTGLKGPSDGLGAFGVNLDPPEFGALGEYVAVKCPAFIQKLCLGAEEVSQLAYRLATVGSW